MYLLLKYPQNISIQGHGQGLETENENQITKEENTGARAEGKRQEDMNPKICPLKYIRLRHTMTKTILLAKRAIKFF